MNKLIYVDEVKKQFPIMKNEFGMTVNEILHKELDKMQPVQAIPLEKVELAREEIEKRATYDGIYLDRADVLEILDWLIEGMEA